MKRPLPPETIRKIKEARKEGMQAKDIAKMFDCSNSTVVRLTSESKRIQIPKKKEHISSEFWDYSIAGEAF